MKLNRKLNIILAVIGALTFFVCGLLIGRLPRFSYDVKQKDMNITLTPPPIDYSYFDNLLIKNEDILPEVVDTQTNIEKQYMLQLVDGELILYKAKTVLKKYTLPNNIPNDMIEVLKVGIESDSLDEIESYLESIYT